MADMMLIESKTVGSGGTSFITFTSIPSTYTDLLVKVSSRTADTVNDSDPLVIRLNGSTSNLSARALYGSGSAAASLTRASNSNVAWTDTTLNTASTFGNAEWYIPNYAGSNNKSISLDSVQENNATDAISGLSAILWSDTSAINQVTILSGNGYNLAQYTTASLYGISNVTSGSKATGGIVSSDGTYWYHMFPYSGTFTPTANLTADYLVIAAGGGAGAIAGSNVTSGGGGAGGLRSTVGVTGGGGSLESALSLTANTAYTVTIGAGGAAGTWPNRGTTGGNSVFSTITSTGGGGGAVYYSGSSPNGVNGGSGGGGSHINGTGGSGTTNQGYAGGTGSSTNSNGSSGGGGGAGAVGANATVGNEAAGGVGGNGVQITAFANATQTGVNGYYAGGGGAGTCGALTPATGGLGGGGAGANMTIAGVTGAANTGGGGGGGSHISNGTYNNRANNPAAGGSGIVIIRYAI
jgi:hypothetical protein